MRWKYDFLLEDEKIGEVLVINDHKGEDVFSNIGTFYVINSDQDEIVQNYE